MSYQNKIGHIGEQIAKNYYLVNKYKIITQNWHSRFGELDLVVEKNNKITLVEVKTRTNYNFGWPEESINQKKLDNIINTYFELQKNLNLPNNYNIDIFIVILAKKNKIKIIHL